MKVNIKFSSQEDMKGRAPITTNEFGTETTSRRVYYDGNSTRLKKQANPYSTNTFDLVEIQRKRFEEIMPNSFSFVNLLHHTVFEDGMSNLAIEIVKRVYMLEPYMTVVWLYQIYGANQHDSEVLDGILRIIAFLEFPTDIALSFTPLLRLALVDESIHCQESAIMLCEVWRTQECVEALKNAKYSDPLLKDYAASVLSEISSELISNAS